ncbi:MAG: ferritin-like domain-containing protein, partial [Paraclostridium sp.]
MYNNMSKSMYHHKHYNDTCNIKETCSFEGIRPATINKPYPDIAVTCKNKCYADILSEDFAGAVSELTAVTQYVNHEIRMSPIYCKAARTLLSIAQAEMTHLQRLGQLIMLLDGESCCELKFNTCYNAYDKPWTPNYINYQKTIRDMILADIDGEHKAIAQYKKHIQEINDPCIQANLARIIEDEMYHIRLLTELLHEIDHNSISKPCQCEYSTPQTSYNNHMDDTMGCMNDSYSHCDC